jgi:hypothetical protein
LICWSLGLPSGYWSTGTSASLPPLTVTCTWTGPHWVWATGPATVREEGAVVDRGAPVPEPEPAVEGGEAATVLPEPASGPASEVR